MNVFLSNICLSNIFFSNIFCRIKNFVDFLPKLVFFNYFFSEYIIISNMCQLLNIFVEVLLGCNLFLSIIFDKILLSNIFVEFFSSNFCRTFLGWIFFLCFSSICVFVHGFLLVGFCLIVDFWTNIFRQTFFAEICINFFVDIISLMVLSAMIFYKWFLVDGFLSTIFNFFDYFLSIIIFGRIFLVQNFSFE